MNLVAYEAHTPDGRTVRHRSKADLGAALARRVQSAWSVTWHSSRKSAQVELKRFLTSMAVSGLPLGAYAAELLPVVRISVPELKWVAAFSPSKNKRRFSYAPTWGETAPVAAVFTADKGGPWCAASWPTSREACDRDVQRLRASHDQVQVCEAWIEGTLSHSTRKKIL